MTTNKQIEIILIAAPHCGACAVVKKNLEELKPEFELNIKEIPATTLEGQELIAKYGIMASPGIIINNEFFAMGGATKKELRNKFEEIIKKS